MQVRQTAQRLLADHLRHRPGVSYEDAQRIEASPEKTFWPGISLDLADATLVDFDLVRASVSGADFSKATFFGAASFDKASFAGNAWFGGATFAGNAWFSGATFSDTASFGGVTFSGEAQFIKATFSGEAWFERATFSDAARFNEATFSDAPRFDGAHVLHLDLDDSDLDKYGENARRVWPEGWTVWPNADDPLRGTLVSSAAGDH